MGSVGFLRFSLLCFDFLAWPTFALGYPLWASIRAIETNASKRSMRKLVIYWTIFSLISLFEIFFVKLIQWLPFWPYIKLVAVCWLVIPQFNGACHVYRCFIHPCLSVNPRDINWFCIPKEKSSREESFLASAETYLKENGPEALEKLITSKAKGKEHILTDADALQVIKRVESTEKNVTAEEQLAKGKEHILIGAVPLQVEKRVEPTEKNVTAEEQLGKGKEQILADADALEVVKRVEPVEKNVIAEEQLVEHPKPRLVENVKEIAAAETQRFTTPAESEEKRPLEILALKKVQREWTCAMCQVTTTSEATLNSHLLGGKHRSKCEELKTSTQTAKNMQFSAAKHKSKPEELKTSTQTAKNLNSAAMKTNESNQAKKNLKICLPGEGSKQNTTEKPKSTRINAACGGTDAGKA